MMQSFLRRAAQRMPPASTRHAPSTPTRCIAAVSQTQSAASLFSSQTPRMISSKSASVAPRHTTSDITGVLAGVAVVTALIGVGKMWWDASSSSSPLPSTTGRGMGAVQEISREDIAAFFTELKASIQQLFTKLPELDEAFRQHLKSQNIEMGEEEYKQTLLQQLFDVLQNIERQVVDARGWHQESFAYALEKYAEDEEIVRLQGELQQIMHAVFPPPELPEHLTPEKMLEILQVLTKGMETAMSEMLAHARAEGITDPAKAMEEYQQIYLDQVEQITFEQMKKHDVSSDIFNLVLQKFYSENATFRNKVEQLYEQQANAFRRLGLDVGTN